jgi:hypothetical protein
MRELTYAEFCELPLKLVWHFSCDTEHVLRQYVNEKHGIAKCVYTPRKISTDEWGKGQTTFKLLATGEEFDTVAGLLAAINKEKT